MWHQLYDSLKVAKTAYPGNRFVPKPVAMTLDQFEKAHGVKLPKSYRDFALLFGAGELAGLFRIATPMTIANDFKLEKLNQDLHGDPDDRLLEGFGLPEVIEQFLFFCSSSGGDFFGWKLDEVTDQANSEYAIYRFDWPPFEKVANSFQEFVSEYVMKPDPARGWTPEGIFSPSQTE